MASTGQCLNSACCDVADGEGNVGWVLREAVYIYVQEDV